MHEFKYKQKYFLFQISCEPYCKTSFVLGFPVHTFINCNKFRGLSKRKYESLIKFIVFDAAPHLGARKVGLLKGLELL